MEDEEVGGFIGRLVVSVIVTYTWNFEDGIDVQRISEISKWMTNIRGRRICDNSYIFRKGSEPSYADFIAMFAPLKRGEGIIICSADQAGINLDIYAKSTLVNDVKITVVPMEEHLKAQQKAVQAANDAAKYKADE